jgi:hypothetical protein
MKLTKFIKKTDSSFITAKFENCSRISLKKGDIVEIEFFKYENKRKGGSHFRISKGIFMINKYSRKKNNLTFNVTALYKHEIVTVRVLISGIQVVKVKLIQKVNDKRVNN